MSSANSVDGVPSYGFQNSGQLLGYPICDRTLAGYNGPQGIFFLWILGNPYSLGELALVGYIF